MELRVPVAITHVVHIGAGFGSDVQAYVEDGLAPIVLVEADPEASVHLKTLKSRHPELQVIQAAVSGQSGPRSFYWTNFSELNGLSRPSGLQDLFPGLKVLAQDSMEAVAVTELLGELNLPQTGGLLVLEAPGEALEILQALSATGWGEAFSVIRVQEGRRPLYEDAPALEDIRNCLSDLGCQVWEDPDSEDPDRPYLLALRSGLADEATATVLALTQALQDSQNTAYVLRQELDHAGKMKVAAALTAKRDPLQSRVKEAEEALVLARQETQALQQQIGELQLRTQASRKDLRRAEGQVELIKDLMSRGEVL